MFLPTNIVTVSVFVMMGERSEGPEIALVFALPVRFILFFIVYRRVDCAFI